MKSYRIEAKTALFVIILIVLFFQNSLLSVSTLFSYVDELVAVIAILYFISGTVRADKFTLAVIAFLIMLWGLFCNMHFGIQESMIAIVEDVISNFKFLFVYLGLSKYMSERGCDTSKILKGVFTVVKPYLLILVFFAALNLVTDIGMDAGTRYGFRMFSFVYGTPGHLINQMTYAIVLLSAEEEHFEKKNFIWEVLSGLVMVSTLKTRAFLLIVIYLALVYFFKIRNRRRLGLEIGIVGLLVALLGYSQFEHYFATDGAPRQMFVAGAVKLVREYFPFGTGFATYGSDAAGTYYSPLYNYLGFSSRWGMTTTNSQFLNDNYLPMVFAQFGLIFAVIFLILIAMYVRNILRDDKQFDTPGCKIMTYAFILDVLLSSIQSSYLAHYSVVTLSVMFFIFFYPNRHNTINYLD
ncbi:MAG: hypothetical protein LUD07_02630 [Clostridiales bacterium]|nr:hypothetical protein [Clostridiales bacterium]